MKKLNCFASGFSSAPARVIFQHGGEAPSQAPTPKGAEKNEQPDLTPEQVKAREQKEAQKRDERLFKELKSKVDELNGQLKKGGEMQNMGLDKDISFQLFDIVEQLNTKLNLGLENTSLDIHSEGGNLVIKYSGFEERHRNFRGEDKPFQNGDTGLDYKVTIKPNMTWEKQFTYEGKTTVEKHP